MSAAPIVNPYSIARPALLLIEAASARSTKRTLQLEQSNFHVTQSDSLKDIFLMRHALQLCAALLNDEIGLVALRASAQLVRSQWPYARILILGRAPHDLEDYLYDDAFGHDSQDAFGHKLQEDALCRAVHKLLENLWQERGHDGAMPAVLGRLTPRQVASWIVQESDPTKGLHITDGRPVARAWPSHSTGNGASRR